MVKLTQAVVGFAVVASLALAGCGQVSPVAADATAASAPTIEVGTDGTATIGLVAALYAAALTADGQPAKVVDVVPGTETLALGDRSPVVMPVFAATLLQQFSTGPAADAETVIGELATAVAPDLGVLQASKVDGGLVWAVTARRAADGVRDLTAVGSWGADRVLAAPAFALASPSGVPALQVAYNSGAIVTEIEDPAARRQALDTGAAAAAAFRRTEGAALDGLVVLADPVGIAAADPLVVLLASDLADTRPDAVLVLDAVQQKLTTDSLAGLARAAAADGVRAATAAWLEAQGLAG